MQVIKSLLILFSVSTAFSLPLSSDYLSFIKWFVVFSIIQVIIGNIYNHYVAYKFDELKTKREAELSKQGVDIVCPCHRASKMFIPIRLNKDNSFKCLECDKNVAVDVKVDTYMATDILDLSKEEDEAFKAAIKKIKQFEG